jgi:hypothetical protein
MLEGFGVRKGFETPADEGGELAIPRAEKH